MSVKKFICVYSTGKSEQDCRCSRLAFDSFYNSPEIKGFDSQKELDDWIKTTKDSLGNDDLFEVAYSGEIVVPIETY